MSPPTGVFVREADGDTGLLDLPEDFRQSAGFGSWRTTVRAPVPVRSPGARFLPVPADGSPEVEAGRVPGFLRGTALLRAPGIGGGVLTR